MSSPAFAVGARSVSGRAIRYFGGDRVVVLRRRSTLRNAVTGERVAALAADGIQAAAAETLALEGTGLRGRLVAGAVLTVSGHVSGYTVQADAEATAAGKLSAAIAPALAAELADGAVVTIATPTAERDVYALRGEEVLEEADTGRRVARRAYHLLGDELAAPAEGDLVVDGAEVFPISEVRPVAPGGVVARWTVAVGDSL